jgi:hypothetical protein
MDSTGTPWLGQHKGTLALLSLAVCIRTIHPSQPLSAEIILPTLVPLQPIPSQSRSDSNSSLKHQLTRWSSKRPTPRPSTPEPPPNPFDALQPSKHTLRVATLISMPSPGRPNYDRFSSSSSLVNYKGKNRDDDYYFPDDATTWEGLTFGVADITLNLEDKSASEPKTPPATNTEPRLSHSL